MATHQRIRSVLKNARYPVGYYAKGTICPRFVGGDIIVSSPVAGKVHISFYRKRDQVRLQKIADFLKEKGYSVEFNENLIYIVVD
jgi:ketopantoate reductase